MRDKHFAFHRFQHEPESHGHGMPGRFGHRGFGWGGFRGSWGRITRRGDIKYLVLEALTEGPRHGYDIINNFEQRFGSRPSPGSIYPTLQMLEDAGHLTSAEQDAKRVYTITDSGRQLLEKRPAG